ncbi:hypothetical protein CN138_25815 [Sinorhizobium meliloti]|jgi:hypothetical protein|uniref:SMI1/KNR4 family protein n=1 Tax=Rhizobium meliloti TaxID=382 RepID=UPI0004F7B23F|nr:SMI1/KNR4 family protein [Sinorhizobium meliloti]AIL99911.1 hypothetical protein DU99_11095 [Sinorhizobium meliloti]ASP98481.1 hypothetical protein CDO24_14190 [Sinorhizobium meliloti]MDW9532463.1 hypothetical protein [Sinorhizobium meliloti]MDW9581606.1 hypothetical protein [Sinorhizobium meliloti]MDW9706115.1 hypothetical protein [Sinorhizobium meliloti]
MINNLVDLLDLDDKNELSSLQPVSHRDVLSIAELFPNISEQYLEFIRNVGTGSTTRDFTIYEPERARLVEQHPSFRIYQSDAYRSVYGRRPEGDLIPDDAVAIGDSGASWRYCLCPSLGEAVFCLDMGGPTFETEAENFFSFVAETVIRKRK